MYNCCNIMDLEVAYCQSYSQKHWERGSTTRSRLWARVIIYWAVHCRCHWSTITVNLKHISIHGWTRLILQHRFFLSRIHCLNKILSGRTHKNDYSNTDAAGSRNLLCWWKGCWKEYSESEEEPENYPWKGIFHFAFINVNRRMQGVGAVNSCK